MKLYYEIYIYIYTMSNKQGNKISFACKSTHSCTLITNSSLFYSMFLNDKNNYIIYYNYGTPCLYHAQLASIKIYYFYLTSSKTVEQCSGFS